MSLMKLLTVGQSLRGIKNEPSPYKINEQHFLPKFAAVGRPVSLAPPKERFAKTVPVRSAIRASAVSPLADTAVASASNAKVAAADEVHRPVFGAKELTSWRLLFSFAARAKSRTRRPLVQGEMTLDGLKVVRNDLSEADLEVVPGRMESSSEPVPAAQHLPAASSVWSRAAAQFSSVTRMWF